jgi:hypothetical protein
MVKYRLQPQLTIHPLLPVLRLQKYGQGFQAVPANGKVLSGDNHRVDYSPTHV